MDEDLTRVPGLFRLWELSEVLRPGVEYRLESAGAAADGTPLLAVLKRPIPSGFEGRG